MPRTKIELSAEQNAWLDQVRAKAAQDRPTEGPPSPRMSGEPIKFYLGLRSVVGSIKSFREKAGLTLAEVASKSGIAEETLCRLETGAATNPTWKTLGDYASAVGMRLELNAVPVSDSQ